MADCDHLISFTTPSGKRFFVWTQWREEDRGFSFTLVSGGSVRRSDVSRDQLVHLAEDAGLELEEYVNLTKAAFGGRSEESDAVFTYDVISEGDDAQLIWKKRISDKVQFQLGSVPLRSIDQTGGVIDLFMEHCCSRFTVFEDRVRALEDENKRLADEHKRALERLTEAAHAKADVEQRFFEAFQDILNSKKRKIVELTEEIDRLHEGLKSGQGEQDDAAGPSVVSKKSTASKKAVRNNYDEGGDTDEENEHLEEIRQEKLQREAANFDDVPLYMTHTDERASHEQSEGHSNGANEEDRLYVPKRKQQKTNTQKNGGASKKQSAAASAASQRSGNTNQRRSNENTMEMISKLG